MIDEIDAALKALLKDEALDGSEVDVVFDAPTKEWAARRNAPTVNAYLYDIREDVRKRTRGMVNEYDDRGIVVGRRLPPRFYNLSYLVTAWTQRPEDEHRLLAQMLFCFSNYEAMPAQRLTGHIGALRLPVEMRISLPPPEDRSFADVWTALGGELKPSIDVVLSVPLSPARVFTVGPPVQEPPVVTLLGATRPAQTAEQRAVGQSESSPGRPRAAGQSDTWREARWADAVRETRGGASSHDTGAGAPTSSTASRAAPDAGGSPAGRAARPAGPAARSGAAPGGQEAAPSAQTAAWLALAGRVSRDASAESVGGLASSTEPERAPSEAAQGAAGSDATPEASPPGQTPGRGRRRRLRVDLSEATKDQGPAADGGAETGERG